MRIALLEALHPDAEALLAAAGDVVRAQAPVGTPALEAAADADAVLTRGQGRITAELLDAAPGLRAVARAGVGLDNVDVATATARGIPVVFAPGATTSSLAEHTMMLILAACRDLCALDRAVAAGHWAVRDGHRGRELAGASLGVVGLGDIGRRVAALAAAFGAMVRTWSPRSRDPAYEHLELDELLRVSDIVSVHVALAAETRHLIDARRLALLPRGATLVNTARGVLVDESAIAAALDRGHLNRYATDVLAAEPPGPNSPLVGHPDVIVTPHVGALTDVAYRTLSVTVAESVATILRGARPEPVTIANFDLVAAARGW